MRPGSLAMLVALAAFAVRPAVATEVKVATVGAFRPVIAALADDFERSSGDRVIETHDTAGVLAHRIESGEQVDLVILTLSGVTDLTAHGKLVAGKTARLARVGIGVAVKEGAPLPVIDDVDAFRQAMLDAPSVAYIDPLSGGSSGIYLTQLFQRLGISEAIRAKAVLVAGGLVGDRLVKGDAVVGLQQISELMAVKGIRIVGPLPDAIQNYTLYAGGVSSTALHPEAAEKFLNFLQSDVATALLREKGMAPPRE